MPRSRWRARSSPSIPGSTRRSKTVSGSRRGSSGRSRPPATCARARKPFSKNARPISAASDVTQGAPSRVTLDSISIRDFRNIERADLAIPPDGIALVGDNGQGKTNFLEAIAYLELLRSMRGVRDRDLTRFNAPAFHIAASSTGTAVQRMGVGVERGGKKRITLDGVDTPRLTDALG